MLDQRKLVHNFYEKFCPNFSPYNSTFTDNTAHFIFKLLESAL
jgi:hypothetical protein